MGEGGGGRRVGRNDNASLRPYSKAARPNWRSHLPAYPECEKRISTDRQVSILGLRPHFCGFLGSRKGNLDFRIWDFPIFLLEATKATLNPPLLPHSPVKE